MSWSSAVGRIGRVVAVGCLLAACGFEPLYGTRNDLPASAEFALIDIKPIKDRAGQELRNRLLDALTPKGPPDHPRYRLTVIMTESIEQLGVQKTAFATRANMHITASYSLLDLRTQTGVTPASGQSGSTKAVASYNILDSAFATLAAENDARTRAIEEIAEEIRLRIAIWLRDR